MACAYVVTALVGLPLFQDGAWYFFKIATSGVPELPNLRYTALLPQLPTAWAAPLVDDAVMLRHVFSLSYVALPVASLLGCWLLVRRRAPALMLFPLLWFLLNLTNFSAVSELLSSLYLTWPLVLAMLLAPGRYWTRAYAGIAAPMLATLHPLAFLPAFALALLAAALAWLWPRLRWAWGSIAALLLVAGLFRLVWTITGVNSYERGRLQTDSAINYLMTETLGQHLLLGVVLSLGVSFGSGDARARRGARLESAVCRSSRLAAAGGRASDWSGGPQWTRHQAQVGRELRGRACADGPRRGGGPGAVAVVARRHRARRDRLSRTRSDRRADRDLHGDAAAGQVRRLVDGDPGPSEPVGGDPRGLRHAERQRALRAAMALDGHYRRLGDADERVGVPSPLYWCSNPIGGSSRCR